MTSAVLLLTLLLSGQCGPGGCAGGSCGVSSGGWGGYTYPMPVYQQPAYQAPAAKPPLQTRPVFSQIGPDASSNTTHPAVCIVSQVERDLQPNWQRQADGSYITASSVNSGGTGVYIGTIDGWGAVLTCNHVIAGGDKNRITCIFPQGSYQAKLGSTDATNDVALLWISPPNVPPIELADNEPAPGMEVTTGGYGEKGKNWQLSAGRVIGWETDGTGRAKWFVAASRNRPGDSGGPVLCGNNLAGIAWGASNGTCSATSALAIKALFPILSRLKPQSLRLLPLPKPPVAVNDVPAGSEKAPASGVTSVAPAPPAIDPCLELRARVAALEKTVANLKTLRGPPGPPGKDGKDGTTPSIDYGVLLEGLPPIRIQTLNLDGSKHQEATARLGDLIILEPIAVKAEAKK